MDKKLDTALAQLAASGELQAALPTITALFDKAEAAVLTRVFQTFNSGGEIGAGYAVQAWMELWAYHKIRNSLTRTLNQGQSAGTYLAKHMETNDG